MTDVRIRGIEVVDIRLPLRREWRWRGLAEDIGRWTLVRVEADNGAVGWGEATALRDWGGDHGRYFGETPRTVRHVIEDVLGPLILGAHCGMEDLVARMDVAIKGHFYAKAALEIAVYDLKGILLDVPLYELLGGKARTAVSLAHMIGLMPLPDAVREAQSAAEEGIRSFQLKGTGDVESDIHLVTGMRSALGNGVMLRLDLNQGLRGVGIKQAIRSIRRLENAGIDLLEQPTEGLPAMAAIRARVDVPFVADESCWQAQDVVDVAHYDAADAISIYLAKAGGITRAKRVAAVAEAFGYPCDVNGSLESGIGSAANLHFALSTPVVSMASVISAPAERSDDRVGGRYYIDDVVTVPFIVSDGYVFPTEEPGLGITVDEEKLNAYRIDDTTLHRKR